MLRQARRQPPRSIQLASIRRWRRAGETRPLFGPFEVLLVELAADGAIKITVGDSEAGQSAPRNTRANGKAVIKPKPPRSALPLPRYVRRKPWGRPAGSVSWTCRRGRAREPALSRTSRLAPTTPKRCSAPSWCYYPRSTAGALAGVTASEASARKGTIDWMFDEFRKTWKKR
jgi:hypothetical protein